MIKTTILAVTILFFGTMMVQEAYAPDILNVKAIPDWVDNNFRWYVDGEIDEATLLTSMNWMFDNNIMHLSEKAAQEVAELREENRQLRYSLERDAEGDTTVLFGDGEHGSVPPTGDPLMTASIHAAAADVPTESGTQKVLAVGSKDIDVNALVQWVLKESYMDQTADLSYYAQKVRFYNDVKKAVRDEIQSPLSPDVLNPDVLNPDIVNPDIVNPDIINPAIISPKILSPTGSGDRPTEEVTFSYSKIEYAYDSVGEVMTKGGTTSSWDDAINQLAVKTGYDTKEHIEDYNQCDSDNCRSNAAASVAEDLQRLVVLCNTAIDKKTQAINAELEMVEEWLDIIAEKQATTDQARTASVYDKYGSTATTDYNQSDLDFLTRKLSHIDQQISSLDTGIMVLEKKLQTAGDDAQLANIDLQNMLQKQQQLIQMLSNISKTHHDTMMSIIRNMSG